MSENSTPMHLLTNARNRHEPETVETVGKFLDSSAYKANLKGQPELPLVHKGPPGPPMRSCSAITRR